MKTVLLISNGAREHALGDALKRSPQGCELAVFAKAKNPGLMELATHYKVAALDDRNALKAFVEEVQPDFAVIGPEAPLVDGTVDFLEELGVKSVGPYKDLAQLEGSKSYTRDLLVKYEIDGNPHFQTFTSPEGIREYMEQLGEYVVKADGLHGGKGVKLSGEHLANLDEGVAYAEECIASDGRVVIEEKFVGEEFSYICLTDGKTVVPCPVTQDHKRAYDGDQGPNTGGMGSYGGADGSLPFLKESDLAEAQKITEDVVLALRAQEGKLYKGVMYGGFIATKNGVRLIEYNARFGDPEAMNILPLLKTDFIAVCEAIIEGSLHDLKLEFEKKATVVKYVVPEGYPDNSVKNEAVEIGELPENVKCYFASVDAREDGLYLGGSRAIGMVGIGSTLEDAEKAAQAAVEKVKGPVFFRKDIGTQNLIQKRIDHMCDLRA